MLNTQQVTALTAQAAKAASLYPSTDESGNPLPGWELNESNVLVYTGDELDIRGVGKYGQSAESLVLTGYLKPASLSLIVEPSMTSQVLNTPACWTGQFGINSLLDYLDSDILQNISQIALLTGSYQGLIDNGYLTGDESPRDVATLIQPAARYGVTAVIIWIEGLLSPEQSASVAIAARQGQYAIDFIDTYGAKLQPGIDLPAFTNTVQRDEVDFALEEIIGNPKIPTPEYADIVEALVESVPNVFGTSPGAQLPQLTDEDGKFRFSPGAPRG
jgi:hypothetical protein